MSKIHHKKWTSKISKWYNVSVDEYKFIFDLAEKRFNDVVSENESITDKTIKILTCVIVFFGFYLGTILKGDLHFKVKPLLYAVMLLCLVCLILAAIVLFPRHGYNKGLSPCVSTTNEFDNDEDKENLLQKLYYNSIAVLQDNIDNQVILNSKRISFYKFLVIGFSILLLFISVDIFTII